MTPEFCLEYATYKTSIFWKENKRTNWKPLQITEDRHLISITLLNMHIKILCKNVLLRYLTRFSKGRNDHFFSANQKNRRLVSGHINTMNAIIICKLAAWNCAHIIYRIKQKCSNTQIAQNTHALGCREGKITPSCFRGCTPLVNLIPPRMPMVCIRNILYL